MINVERMRYKNDSASFWLCMIGLATNIIQFMFIYSNIYLNTLTGKTGFKYYMIGVDVVLNILFMLFAFYTGEELKTYHRKWAVAAFAMGIFQIARIKVFPKQLFEAAFINEKLLGLITIICIFSAASLFAAAVLSFVKSTMLINFLNKTGETK